MIDNNNSMEIDKGYIIDFIKPKITGPYIDFGSDTDWLLSEVPGGVCIDASKSLMEKEKAKGLNGISGRGTNLSEPIQEKHSETAVLLGILKQYVNWEKIIDEALRVSEKVIGVNPVPASKWGVIRGDVKSVIYQEDLVEYIKLYKNLQISFEDMKYDMYYFEIRNGLKFKHGHD